MVRKDKGFSWTKLPKGGTDALITTSRREEQEEEQEGKAPGSP